MNDLVNEKQPIEVFAQQAYLDYAMYVILDRALPQIGDGLKPVQRRIIYSMSELGLKHLSKYKKSARTIGDVIGKFHPHGDSACYEAMVLMAQRFNYRYPIIDGQGNWGSADDPKSFAAMRYTEAKLTAYAQVFLKELSQGTVDWQPNFDGTMKEPRLLPARVPNLLLNGSSGIAVGMTTDIPPHNIGEVLDACLLLLSKPSSSIDDVMEFIKGPDFPMGSEIISSHQEIKAIYETGSGNIRARATYEKQDKEIIITQTPFQTTSSRIIKQIAEQMQAKKVPMIQDVQDQSDYDNAIRICLSLKSSRVNADEVMSHLFASTDLEKSLRIHLNIIGMNRKPRIMSLIEFLKEWLSFRTLTVSRRCEHRLAQVKERLHLLEGLLTIFDHLDEVIRIIRYEDDPKEKLMTRFCLSEEQTLAILNTRLKQLAKLEQIQLKKEHDLLVKERADLEELLSNPQKLKNLIRKEIKEDRKELADERRSLIIERDQAKAIRIDQLVQVEPISIFLSKNEWVRYGKSHDIEASQLNFKTGDGPNLQCRGKSDFPIILLNQKGRSFSLSPHQLPSIRSAGEPISKHIQTKDRITSLINASPKQFVLLCSDNGYGFISSIEQMVSKNKAGKQMISITAASSPLEPILIEDNWKELFIAVATKAGRLLIFSLEELPFLNKGKGNKLIQLQNTPDDRIQCMVVFSKSQNILIGAGKRTFKLTEERKQAYTLKRARKGSLLPRGFARVDFLVAEEKKDTNSS
ncbi:MAG TPA: DNA topoisomerase IV subunit A [Gammaproteobacteria bacterium]|nr:DNA topoisomerase IV subunit A [Gammaproteobacteria bacterium]